MSKIQEVLSLLETNSNPKGYVTGLDTEQIARMTGLSKHDANKFLFDLNRRGAVGFSVRKGGQNGSTILYRFRLKMRTLNEVKDQVINLGEEEMEELAEATTIEVEPEEDELPDEEQAEIPIEDKSLDWAKYPTITASVTRHRQRLRALAILRESGDDDLADMLQAELAAGGALTAELSDLLLRLGYYG